MWRVKKIERFVAKFQLVAFPHNEALEKRKVPVERRRSNERVPAKIPRSDGTPADRGRDGECRYVDLLGGRVAGQVVAGRNR